MNKWLRSYKLTIGTNDGRGDIIIQPPLSIVFSTTRNLGPSSNDLQLQIYNLSYEHRQRIFQDTYQNGGIPNYKPIKLEAGYLGNLSIVFQGNYISASSVREGSNIVTYIVSQDGIWDTINTKTYTTLKGGLTVAEVLKQLAGDFKNIKMAPNIAPLPANIGRPVVLEGNTWDLMRKYSRDLVFIDLETIKYLGQQYAIKASIPLISADSGLLSTPRSEGSFIVVSMLLEPAIVLGQIIQLQSNVQREYDGQYKVQSISHVGTISEAINGKCITTLSLSRPPTPLKNYSIL